MANPYKIKISSAGVSTDVFQIMYDVSGNSSRVLANIPCGGTATAVTQDQLVTGFTVLLPSNALNVYIVDIGGICDGRANTITL
jgi:hypothetical protein